MDLYYWGIYILQPSEFGHFVYVFSFSHLNIVVLHIIMFVYHMYHLCLMGFHSKISQCHLFWGKASKSVDSV